MEKVGIIGVQGQDGTLLSELLGRKGFEVLGLHRSSTVNILNLKQMESWIQQNQPSQVYYLAAYHHSSEDVVPSEISLYEKSRQVHLDGFIHLLEAVRLYSPQTRIFYAASSLVFGQTSAETQNEMTPFLPETPYALTKVQAIEAGRYYRRAHRIWVSIGILYNHESRLRKEQFLSQKIVKAAVAIQKGLQKDLVLGSLISEVDWGDARDYIEAMYAVLNCFEPQDFVIASGEKHSVVNFLEVAFSSLGLKWQSYVREDSSVLRRNGYSLQGDSSRLQRVTGWKPKYSFSEMIRAMLESEGGLLVK